MSGVRREGRRGAHMCPLGHPPLPPTPPCPAAHLCTLGHQPCCPPHPRLDGMAHNRPPLLLALGVQEQGINTACQGRVVRIDVGMSRGCGDGAPEVLEILNDTLVRQALGSRGGLTAAAAVERVCQPNNP